ncbi:MAG: histidine phosphatase family protein [Chloroflexi bacterium]|nr:histidine phosphatase family protein [Chloroflexota bacterium]
MLRLLMIRHGQTLWNKEQRYNGKTDLGLTRYGFQQAERLGERVRRLPVQRILTSGLKRAMETVQAINTCREQPLPVYIDQRWQEIDYGEAEGLRWPEIVQRFPQEARRWAANDPDARFPRGESLREVAQRVRSTLDELVERYQQETLAVVAHGGPLRVALCVLVDLPLQQHWNFNVAACTLSEVAIYPSGTVINLLNDGCHLHERDHPATSRET